MKIFNGPVLRAIQPPHRARAVGFLLTLLFFGMLLFAFKSTPSTQPNNASQARLIRELVQACTVQMIKNTCRVTTGPAADPARARLFIAGVGEVDAAAYADLQRHGDAMCQSAGAHCQSDWLGASCRIAKALYLSPG